VSLYLEQIRQLISLQKVDDEIFNAKNELEAAPKEIEKLRAAFSEMNVRRDKCLEKIAHLKEQSRRITTEMEEETSRLRKSKNKLMQVANSREYQAMTKEMDSLERHARTREKESVAVLEELNFQEGSLVEMDGAWKSTSDELKEREETLDARLMAISETLMKLEKSRLGAGSKIPPPVLARYEFIRKRLDHPVIVPVENGICEGCRIAIPPQDFIELQSGHKILNCPNCQRLIFWSEHFAQASKED
jgi:predicted  nucleic acid-binding Zn-ribbon protein